LKDWLQRRASKLVGKEKGIFLGEWNSWFNDDGNQKVMLEESVADEYDNILNHGSGSQ